MALEPIYTNSNVRPVHNLRFDWTGWPSTAPLAAADLSAAIEACRAPWQAEGIAPDTFRTREGMVQILAATTPAVSPVFFAHRIKGRLQHALRQVGAAAAFRRKVSVRSLGGNTREVVEAYVDRQAGKSDYVDPRFKEFLGHFALSDDSVHLEAASPTAHGRYWYNLHLVVVVADRRYPVTRTENFRKLRRACAAIADKNGYGISRLAVMPDHIHIALRGVVEESPEDIALAYLNNLSYVMGYNRCWSREYYVGTFSEYGMGDLAVPGSRSGAPPG